MSSFGFLRILSHKFNSKFYLFSLLGTSNIRVVSRTGIHSPLVCQSCPECERFQEAHLLFDRLKIDRIVYNNQYVDSAAV